VKYIKRNFARHRSFTNVDKLNEQCFAWLSRTGNATVHHTIKKIPAEVYALEKAHLRPVHKKIQINNNPSITRVVRKDNTILYESNRYTVPLGTYGPGKEVGVRVTEDKRLIIYEVDSGSILAEHALCLHGKGKLIRNNNTGETDQRAFRPMSIMSRNNLRMWARLGVILRKFTGKCRDT